VGAGGIVFSDGIGEERLPGYVVPIESPDEIPDGQRSVYTSTESLPSEPHIQEDWREKVG